MATAVEPEVPVLAEPSQQPPLLLKTWKEVRDYFAAHLTPTRFNNGRPVYSNDDIKKLNVLLPDEH